MPIFTPDIADVTDAGGFGVWLNSHGLEHLQFVNTILTIHPTANPNPVYFDIGVWGGSQGAAFQAWISAHAAMHHSLQSLLGIATGWDATAADFTDQAHASDWMQSNSQEHSLFRQLLGII